MFILVVELGGHLAEEGGEECIHSGIVLLEEFLPCGSGLLDGAYCGIGGLLYGVDAGLRYGIIAGFDGAIILDPLEEGAACYTVFSCYPACIACVYVFLDNDVFEPVVIQFLFFLPYSLSYTLFHLSSTYYGVCCTACHTAYPAKIPTITLQLIGAGKLNRKNVNACRNSARWFCCFVSTFEQ